MMRLRTAKASPFGRKVWICALRTGLMERIRLEEVNWADPADPLEHENPLRKMPVLILESGEPIFDSPVIVEYLDNLSGGALIPRQATARISALKMQALCDGIMDAGALIVMEGRMRPKEMHSRPWLDEQRGKIRRALKWIELDMPSVPAMQIDGIALACALGFLDRRKQIAWRQEHPLLSNWLGRFAEIVPEYGLTHVPPDPDYVSP